MNARFLIPFAVLTVATLASMALYGILPPSAPPSDAVATVTETLPLLGTVPEFTLTNEDGQEFGSRQLAGKVWVATFIFTRCPGTCPVQTMRMGQLQKQLAAQPGWDDVRLVSFSVDPEYDTPAVLRAYARQAGAEPGHWYFLTGPRDDIWQLSKDGFKLDVGEAPLNAFSPLFHSYNLMVVDRQARIRGYYSGMTEEGIEQVLRAVEPLLNEGPRNPDGGRQDLVY